MLNEVKTVSCNVCGADEFKVVFEKAPERGVHHRIVQCRQCQLLYANPQEVIDCEDMARAGGSDEFDDNCSYFVKQRVQIPDNLRACFPMESS